MAVKLLRASTDDLLDHSGRVFIGDALIAPFPLEYQVAVVQAEQVQNCGVKVVHAYVVFRGTETDLIGGAVYGAAFDAAAGHPHRKARRPVIAPRVSARSLGNRQASK